MNGSHNKPWSDWLRDVIKAQDAFRERVAHAFRDVLHPAWDEALAAFPLPIRELNDNTPMVRPRSWPCAYSMLWPGDGVELDGAGYLVNPNDVARCAVVNRIISPKWRFDTDSLRVPGFEAHWTRHIEQMVANLLNDRELSLRLMIECGTQDRNNVAYVGVTRPQVYVEMKAFEIEVFTYNLGGVFFNTP